MKRKEWTRFFAGGCIVAMLMTSPGMTVLADEMPSEEVILTDAVESDGEQEMPAEESDQADGEETQSAEMASRTEEVPAILESMPAEGEVPAVDYEEEEELEPAMDEEAEQSEEQAAEENFAEESTAESEGAEIAEEAVDEFKQAEESGEYSSGDVSVETLVETAEESNVQDVGASTWTVGNGVTAKMVVEGGKNVLYFNSKGGTLWNSWRSQLGSSAGKINIIKFTGDSTKMYFPKDSRWLFNGDSRGDECALASLEKIDLKKADTSRVEDMVGMFDHCTELKELDLSSFNTANVKRMNWMFSVCESLVKLNLHSFNTSMVTDMSYMFVGCSNLSNLDLSSFNTSRVTNISYMFVACNKLSSLDLSCFDTRNVTNMSRVFENCRSLTTLNLSNFNTAKVTYIDTIFAGCTNLKYLDISNFDLTQAVSVSNMFLDDNNLQIIDTPKKNTSSIALPTTMYDSAGKQYTSLPKALKSIRLARTKKIASEPFVDVIDPSAWYYDSVHWAVKKGITSGMGGDTFQPMARLSRAQTVTFLYNLAGKPDVSKLRAKDFSDVPKSAWYYNAVKWAVANKITSGYGTGTFQPNTTCTRAMVVTFLANYAKAAGTYKAPTKSSNFKDVAANAWYKKSVDWAVQNGITSGYGQGTFSPNVTSNRAMMVTFLKKVAELRKV